MKRLILFEFHHLGDAVMSLPFLNGARQKYDVFVCCSNAAAKIYELILPPERVIRLEIPSLARGNGYFEQWKQFWKAYRELKRLKASLAICVWADVRVHLLMLLLGIPERVGFEMNEVNYYAHHISWRKRNLRNGMFIQKFLRFFGWNPLTKSLVRKDYQQHHVLDWSQLAMELDVPFDVESPWIDAKKLSLPPAAEHFFQQHRGRKTWLLHPGAAKECKRWPHFDELVSQVFLKNNVPLVILIDPNAPRIKTFYDNCLHLPFGSLSDFIAVIAQCDVVLCNDSAAAHIAAALGKQVITIFSSGSSFWFSPFTSKKTLFESSVCPFRPCLDRCLQPSYICLEAITLETVSNHIEMLLNAEVAPRAPLLS